MAMAAMIDNRDPIQPATPPRHIASVDIITDLAAAEPIWRALEMPDTFATPYQRFDLQAAWQRHVGVGEDMSPFIIVAYDAKSEPLLLLPLGLRQENGARIAQNFGGKHMTFNMPLWNRDFATSATRDDLDTLIAGIKAHPVKADVLALTRQPGQWMGIANPMASLPHQASINECPLLTMVPGAPPAERLSNSFRRRLKGKERKLQVLPGYRSFLASTDAEVTRVLDAFFAIQAVAHGRAEICPMYLPKPGVEGLHPRRLCGDTTAADELHHRLSTRWSATRKSSRCSPASPTTIASR